MYTTATMVATAAQKPPTVQVRQTSRDPIGVVALDGGNLLVSSTNPAALRLIAEAFTDCARLLSDELDKAAGAVA